MRSTLTLLLMTVLGTRAAAQSRFYVDDTANGANDGTSWTDAFTDLQSAIAAASDGSEIWVATGTYRPSPIGDRTAAFWPGPGQKLYGGFAGIETALDQRAGLFDQTVLSGDLAGDDGPDFAHRSDNTEHILTFEFGTFGATLDGFTIRGGHAAQSVGGGAWYFDGFGDPRALNCTFEDNDARGGGGAVWVGNYSGSSFEACTFLGNRAGAGGAAYRQQPGGKGYLDFSRCRFLGNLATGTGGGAFAGSWAGFSDSLFSGNRADGTSQGGGAILASVYIVRCTVYGNQALGGPLVGGIRGLAVPTACILWGNRDDRGTIAEAQYRNDYHGWTQVDECCIQGWSPDLGGGRVLSGDPEFVDPLGADGVLGTRDDDLRLGRLSPCIDALRLMNYTTVDLDGAPRQHESRSCAEGILDLGAYERQWLGEPPTFCPATASSLGLPAWIDARCLFHLGGGAIDVYVAPVPDGSGVLLLGSARTLEPFGNGFRCLGGRVYPSRTHPTHGGTLHFRFDPAHFPGAEIAGGSTWNLQAIYRDPAAGGARVNASEAIAVTILP